MASIEFRLKKIDETRNYLLREIKYKDLIIEKHKKTYRYLNYVEHLVIACISISAFASLVCVPVVITSSARAITDAIKKYKSVIKKS